MTSDGAPRSARPLWTQLAVAWDLPIEAMPQAVHHLRARLLSEQGELKLTSFAIRADGTERRWYRVVSSADPHARIVTTRPAGWPPLRKARALGQMRQILGERLDFTQQRGAG